MIRALEADFRKVVGIRLVTIIKDIPSALIILFSIFGALLFLMWSTSYKVKPIKKSTDLEGFLFCLKNVSTSIFHVSYYNILALLALSTF